MYAIYGNIYHQYTPNVSIYSIHGSYGDRNDFETKGRLSRSEHANASYSIQIKGMNSVSTCREQASVVPKARPGIFKCL